MDQKQIAIIGGGLTGLAAAYKLALKGCQVTIFEQGDYVGGLASGFKINNQSLEKAYHHIFTTDQDILELVKELGLENNLLYLNSSMATYYAGHIYPFSEPKHLLRFKPFNLFDKIRFGLVTLYLKQTKNWRQFVSIKASQWIVKYYGSKIYGIIWQPLLKGKFHKLYQEVSMAWLFARVNTRANSSDKNKEKLVYFKGGFQVIIDALSARLEALGVKIIFNANIEQIIAGQKPSLKLANDQILDFDTIICTTPSHVFAKLIANNSQVELDYLKKLNSIDYLGAVLIIFSSQQSLSKYYWHNISDLESPFVVFLQHTNLVDKSYYGDEHVYYLGAYLPHDHKFFQMTEVEIYYEWFKYLKKIYPEFDPEQITNKYLFRFKNAQHVVTTDYESKIPAHETPLPGVYLANFSQIFPEDRGTNFAVREGIKVAEMI